MTRHLVALMALRWAHVMAAVIWMGFSYFTAFVIAPAAAKAASGGSDGDARGAFLGLVERSSRWVRWSSLATFLTGWTYIFWFCAATGTRFHGENGLGSTPWGLWVQIGSVLGTLLFINAWAVILPAQSRHIRLARSGSDPQGAARAAATAANAARVNIYASAPLVFMMLAAGSLPVISVWIVLGVLVIGLAFIAHLYVAARAAAALVLLSAAVLWTSFAAAAEPSASSALAKPKLDGRALYVQHCARCHGDLGTGDGDAFTMQRPWPRDFTTGEYKFRSTPIGTLPLLSDVERVVAKGIPRTSMSGYDKWLSADEIRRVSEYVLSLSRASGLPEAPEQAVRVPVELGPAVSSAGPVPLSAERLARGRETFAVNCASCHGADGRGLGELAGQMRDKNGFLINPVDLTDALGYGGGSSAADIYRTLTAGIAGSPMPAFDKTLDDAARADVAAYVRSLQVAPADRTLPSAADWQRALPSPARGEYLVRSMSCALCHNSYDETGSYYAKPYLAGGVAITLPGLGVFPTRNITAHPQDGIGGWSEEELVRAITTGHARDRRIEAFSMPWVYFSHLTEEDARDVAAYLKQLKPMENRVPPRRYDPIWERLWTRLKQVTGLEPGRLEYPAFNVGSRPSQAERLDERRERDARLRRLGILESGR